ncbi:tRNA-U16,U17-dihydrouridine synthase [Turneriella parva DSM 21527]|uniref:tRNA-dihydrouridine synthase n=1 Tax=Turneriella parva (strain ATCC BAA-1111 / DSM 21527 / NCTC 11395 / H) TaxID=869212 RepID=I4B699_TURPD|nr:tRNA-U16,U17-dihydrouridine synthase [Turneriella parva DSM 21527]
MKSYSSENAAAVAAHSNDAAGFPWSRVSIAPMMDITDRRFRYFMRLINPKVRLYTEMIVCHAIVRGDRQRLLEYDASQHPVVLQLGGDDPQLMAEAAAIAEGFGYDGIDINCGCPSTRVESGNFGVCLMRSPDLVAQIVSAVKNRVAIPVTVKCRIGITGEFSEDTLARFAGGVFAAGADSLTVHARTATIGGLRNADDTLGETRFAALTPKQNREIPPLQYDVVYRLKDLMPARTIEINGGIKTREAIQAHLQKVDRVMLGRLAHEDPWFFYEPAAGGVETRWQVLDKMAEYASRYEKPDLSASRFFTNMLNLFHGIPGARHVRRFLSEEGRTLTPAAAVHALQAAGVVA